jgi:DNA-binding MarR family transcriptional regulator
MAPMVACEPHGRILVISLRREHKRNAVDQELSDGSEAALDRLEGDPDLWCGILTGTTAVFSTGTDLSAGSSPKTDRGGEYGLVRRRRTKPLIAALEGPGLPHHRLVPNASSAPGRVQALGDDPADTEDHIQSIQRDSETLLRQHSRRCLHHPERVVESGVQLSKSCFEVLRILPDAPMVPMSRLAELVGMAATRTVDKLHDNDYVMRTSSQTDRRLVLLSITPRRLRAYQVWRRVPAERPPAERRRRRRQRVRTHRRTGRGPRPVQRVRPLRRRRPARRVRRRTAP